MTESRYVNVTLSCDDSTGSGCNSTYYCNDTSDVCTPNVLYTGIPIYIDTVGTSYVRYNSVDNLNTTESVSSRTIVTSTLYCGMTFNANSINTLTTDRFINGSNCFNITAENVTINCAGFDIIGNNSLNTIAIYSNKFNTTVKNCNISGFNVGVQYYKNSRGTIFNNSIFVNLNSSVAPLYASAILLFNNTNNTLIVNNNVTSFNGSGILVYANSYNNQIINNTANSTYYGGIYIYLNSNNNTIFSSKGSSSTNVGIYVGTNSQNNTVNYSTGTSSSNAGIYVLTSLDNKILNSNGTSNSNYGIYLVTTANGNRLDNVRGISTSSAGIYLNAANNNN